MKILSRVLLSSIVLIAPQVSADDGDSPESGSQAMQHSFTIKGDGDFVLVPGIMALVNFEDDNLIVSFAPDLPERDDFPAVDIKPGDQIMMCNGRRVSSLDMLRERLDAIAVGDTIKLGIRRDQELMIVSFPKVERSETDGGMRVMAVPTPGDNSPLELSQDIDLIPILELGIVASMKDESVVVFQLLPENLRPANLAIKSGDRLVAAGGEKLTDISQLQELCSTLGAGANLGMTIDRDGTSIETTVTLVSTVGKPRIKMGVSGE